MPPERHGSGAERASGGVVTRGCLVGVFRRFGYNLRAKAVLEHRDGSNHPNAV